MTRDDFKDIHPGMMLKIASEFVESPHPDLVEYLGTTQVFQSADYSGVGWVYCEGLPQPFAMSEIKYVVRHCECIDDEDYDVGDISMILGQVI